MTTARSSTAGHRRPHAATEPRAGGRCSGRSCSWGGMQRIGRAVPSQSVGATIQGFVPVLSAISSQVFHVKHIPLHRPTSEVLRAGRHGLPHAPRAPVGAPACQVCIGPVLTAGEVGPGGACDDGANVAAGEPLRTRARAGRLENGRIPGSPWYHLTAPGPGLTRAPVGSKSPAPRRHQADTGAARQGIGQGYPRLARARSARGALLLPCSCTHRPCARACARRPGIGDASVPPRCTLGRPGPGHVRSRRAEITAVLPHYRRTPGARYDASSNGGANAHKAPAWSRYPVPETAKKTIYTQRRPCGLEVKAWGLDVKARRLFASKLTKPGGPARVGSAARQWSPGELCARPVLKVTSALHVGTIFFSIAQNFVLGTQNWKFRLLPSPFARSRVPLRMG